MFALGFSSRVPSSTHQITAQLPVQFRNFSSINFRGPIELSRVKIVRIDESGSFEHRPPSEINGRRYRTAVGMIVDAYDGSAGQKIQLTDLDYGGGNLEILDSGRYYLVYCVENTKGYLTWQAAIGSGTSYVSDVLARDKTERGVSFAFTTNASKLPREGASGERLLQAMLDALEASSGASSLNLEHLFASSHLLELESPFTNIPLVGPVRRIVEICDKATDPVLRLATASLLGRLGVVDSESRYANALCDFAESAPENFRFLGADPIAPSPSQCFRIYDGSKPKPVDFARLTSAAVQTRSVWVQDLLLPYVSEGSLSQDQAVKLANALVLRPTTQLPFYSWKHHLEQIVMALEANRDGYEARLDPQVGKDPETGEFSLERAISYWRSYYHVKG